jgi:hypothetical protein
VADEPIQITVTSNVDPAAQTAIEGIATASDTAATATAQLQAQMSQFGGVTGQATIGHREFAAALALTGNDLRTITPSMIGYSDSMKVATSDLRGLTQAQVDLYRAQQEGKIFSEDLNASFALTGKSARESAQAFIEAASASEAATATIRGYTAAQLDLLKAQQAGAIFLADLNASFGLNSTVTKSARDSASAMAAALDAEDAAFAAVAVSLAQHNAQIATASTLVSEFRTNLQSTAVAEKEVAATTGQLKSSLSSLGGFIIAAFAVNEVQKAADSYIQFQNSIKLAGLSANDTALAMDRLRDTADKNGVTITSVSTIYRRLALEQDRLGASTQDIIHFIDTVTDAFRINGTTAAASQRVIYDLSEAISGNTVQWRNIRQIIQQAPEVLQLAANGIKGMNGDVNKLTDALKGSTFSTQEFFRGLVAGYKEADVLAAKTTLTISGTVNVLVNAFELFVGKSGEASGAIQVVNTAILLVAHNLPLIADGVIAFGAAWAVVKAFNIAQDLFLLGATLVTTTIPALVTFTTGLITETIPAIAAFATSIFTGAVPALVALGAGLIEPTLIVLGIAAAFVAVGVAVLAAAGHLDLIPRTIAAVTSGFKSALDAVTGTASSFLGLNQNSAAAGAQFDNIRTKLGSFSSSAATATSAASALNTGTQALTASTDQFHSKLIDIAKDANGAAVYINRLGANVIQLKSSLDSMSASAETATSRLAALSSYRSAAPGLFNDPSNDNGNFTTLPTQTSFPDIITGKSSQPAYASGGSFFVGGSTGVDTNQVRFKATRGERVDILTPEQQRNQEKAIASGNHVQSVTVTIITKDLDSFRNSRAQVARDIGSMLKVGSSNG